MRRLMPQSGLRPLLQATQSIIAPEASLFLPLLKQNPP
jgi:hypothetical protein